MAEEQWWTNGVERQGVNMQDVEGSYGRQTTQEGRQHDMAFLACVRPVDRFQILVQASPLQYNALIEWKWSEEC
jgi:hypothetical protein